MPEYKGSYIVRPESPALEAAAASAIEQAFRELIERRYLYQKISLDFSGLNADVAAAVAEALRQVEIHNSSPGSERVSEPEPATADRLRELHKEVETRPWELLTRHVHDDPAQAAIIRYAGAGTQPVGTPLKKMDINFYLPAVQMLCPGQCKKTATFTALSISSQSHFGSPYPRTVNDRTEQVFVPVYRCELCRETLYVMLVRRIGGRLHLCGFAPRRESFITKAVPELLAPILHDAEQSVAEGDTFAAMYHLRTMIEHYLKRRLGLPIDEQIRGEDLVRRHYASLQPGISSALPPLSSTYEKLSHCLHTRIGEPADYVLYRDQTCKHIESLEVLGPAANLPPAQP